MTRFSGLRVAVLAAVGLAIMQVDAAKRKKTKRGPIDFTLSEAELGRELVWRASEGDTKAVKALLEHGIPADKYKDARVSTPLMKAATARAIPCMELLLDAGADINHQNAPGWTPLMLAIKSLEPAAMKMLILRGADLNIQDKKRYTALMHAAAQGGHEQAEQVKLMVDAGADYNMKDDYGWSALDIAEEGGYPAVSELLKHYIKIPETGGMDSRTKELYDIAVTPLKKFSDENLTRAIYIMSHGMGDEGVEGAVKADDYGDGKASRSLQKAAQYGNVRLVRAILESPKSAQIDHGTAPQDSGQQSDENMDIQDGFTALILSSAGGKIEVVKYLLEKGANINVCDRMGRSALYWAAKNGRVDTVKLLLAKGADVMLHSRLKVTALQMAMTSNFPDDEIKTLIKEAVGRATTEPRLSLPVFYDCKSMESVDKWEDDRTAYCCEWYGLGCIRMPSIEGDSRKIVKQGSAEDGPRPGAMVGPDPKLAENKRKKTPAHLKTVQPDRPKAKAKGGGRDEL